VNFQDPPELALREKPLDEVILVGDIWEWKDSHHFVMTVMVVDTHTEVFSTYIKIWILRYRPNLKGEEGTYQKWHDSVLLTVNGWKLVSRL
jgi:hypothetical protein